MCGTYIICKVNILLKLLYIRLHGGLSDYYKNSEIKMPRNIESGE